jgi:predicted permease
MRHLEDAGLPPASEPGVPCEVPAGDQLLVCVADQEERQIVVVTLRAADASAPGVIARVMSRWTKTLTGGGGMGSVTQDIKYAVRSLAKAPAFTTTAILTLALGIGATAAIFSVARGVLLTPLPYGQPDRVATVWSSWVAFPDKTWVSQDEYRYYVQNNRTFDDLALYGTTSANFTAVENPERVGAAYVTPNIFSVLRVTPILGRVPTVEDSRQPLPPILIGHEAWQRRYDGNRDIVGRSVEVDGQMMPVMGVLPAGFRLPVDYGSSSISEIFVPFFVDVESPVEVRQNGGDHGNFVVGRLAEGVSVAAARADLVGLIGQLTAEGIYPVDRAFAPRVFSAKDDILGGAKGIILVLLGAVGFVLLIACANVANLLLSRAEGRGGEVAVRTVLGAGRARIVRQLLTESLILATVAGALGFAVAAVGMRALMAIDPDAIPRSASISLDGTVVAFTFAVSLITAVVFGLAPALRVSRASMSATLREDTRGAGARARGNRTQGLLVAAQMAMAVVLLAGSGLMMRTFVQLQKVDTGLGDKEVLSFRVSVPSGTYPEPQDIRDFHAETLRRIRDLPGVVRAAAVRNLPLANTIGDAGIQVEGYERGENEGMQADWQFATPSYFEAMGIEMIQGRTFTDADDETGDEVIVINETLARKYWAGRDPVGTRMRATSEWATVVGVVGNVTHNGRTGEVKGKFYRPVVQVADGWINNARSLAYTVQTEGDPYTLLPRLREVVKGMDPSIPVAQVRTLDEVLEASVSQPRFALTLLGVFAGVALVLALIGIYGVLTYAVSRRTQEIGIRMALGAERGSVVGLVVRQGMVMAVLGVAIGTGLALGLTRFMEGMLYGVDSQDPATFLAVPALFGAVALLACWIPAARAARVAPSTALRYE